MNKFHSSLINRNKEISQNIIFIYFIIGSSNGRIIYIYTSQSGPSIEKSVPQTLTSIYFLDRTLSKTTFEINNLTLMISRELCVNLTFSLKFYKFIILIPQWKLSKMPPLPSGRRGTRSSEAK
jgi:hypothetical protein